ncbi:MAG: ATP-binding cassette domain-containing protein [Clostridiales Family XIII bacterium]|jgi:branched-chain amino acid transport system ATP-binding protein|nr:ATP-binding cassette domain-containing protein [Clostridiales Family XIII bacterium]
MAILSVSGLAISFGSNHVLKSVNFELNETEVLGVIGPNGAGKTVMLNILTGLLKPTAGSIVYMGADITGKSLYDRGRMGFGRTFQIPRPFEKLTAYENVMVGGIFGDGLSEKAAGSKASEILELIGLYPKAGVFAGKLGLLDRKRLEIGVALASNPKILLFDEVAGGLTESEVVEILNIVLKLKADGVSFIWIEHVLKTMLEGTDRVMCLAQGRDVVCGLPAEVLASKEVSEVYLGADEDE